MNLSDVVSRDALVRDATFVTLGYVDSKRSGVLAYADTATFLARALSNAALAGLVTTPSLAATVDRPIGLAVSNTPRDLFYDIHERFVRENSYRKSFEEGIGLQCRIHPTATIEAGARIGNYTTIGEHAIIRSHVSIGSGVTIEPGVKIGMEGILYRKTISGPRLIPHGGFVIVDDGAILMTNAVVVRAVHDTEDTVIGASSLIGLSSIIGHEAKIGARAVVSNNCVVARRSVIGEDAFLGTNVTIKENLRIGHHARIMAGSVVITPVADGKTVSGNFATDHDARMLAFSRIEAVNRQGRSERGD